eukprot:TRINITY_DN23708_c0_g2_i1.p1 TRINITY_DN23708_c0_g2~~TRINITY_DN23708_c0_g2_i1.p1  ORF type:complete len:485 (-),score=78.80 TRINITY_DN23708_c0_g2_i1:78-1532(-)
MQQLRSDDATVAEFAESKTTILMLYILAAVKGADMAMLPASFRAMERDLAMTPQELGMLALCQGVSMAMAGPFWGNLVDSGVSRKLLLKVGTSAWGFCTFQLAFVSGIWMMAFLRVLNGFALAIVLPVSQSYLADVVAEHCVGEVCGRAYLAANLGQVCTALIVLPLSEQIYFGSYMGWRVALAAVGIASLLLAFVVELCALEDRNMFRPERLGISSEIAKLRNFMKISTFNVVLLQGFFGTIPGSAQSFMIMYFQYMGISNSMCALMKAILVIGRGLGGALGGMLGDEANVRSPNYGRTTVAIVSLLNSIPLTYMVLMGLPREASMALPLAGLLFSFGILTAWETPGCLQPVMLRIVSKRQLSSALAWDMALSFTSGNCIGPMLVGYIAQEIFHYQPSDQSLEDISQDVRMRNARALGNAIFFSSVIPSILCCMAFTLMWRTYPKDMRLKEEREAEESEGSKEETTWLLKKKGSAAVAKDPQV